MLITQNTPDQVKEIISKYYNPLLDLVTKSWGVWAKVKSLTARETPGIVHSHRSIGSMMNDILRIQFKVLQDGFPKLECREKNGIFCIVIEGKIIVRFNLMNTDGMTMHTPSEQSKQYRDPQYNLFPDIKPIKKLYAGFVIDAAEVNIVNLLLLERNRVGQPIWMYDILGNITEQTELIPISIVKPEEEQPTRIRAKKQLNKKKTGTNNDE